VLRGSTRHVEMNVGALRRILLRQRPLGVLLYEQPSRTSIWTSSESIVYPHPLVAKRYRSGVKVVGPRGLEPRTDGLKEPDEPEE
jgi:hypothetical protein